MKSAVILIVSISVLQTIGLPLDTLCPSDQLFDGNNRNNNTSEVPLAFKFFGVDSILKSLDEYNGTTAVHELLKIYHRLKENNLEFKRLGGKKNHPLIVLEGLAGSGKSTLADGLTKKMNGIRHHSPSTTVSYLRPSIINDTLLYDIYHYFSHYITALEIEMFLKDTPVILDRYWHSTVTFSLAHPALNSKSYLLPPKGHKIYQWPLDLLKPDIVLFIDVDENTRIQRISKRNDESPQAPQVARKFPSNEQLIQNCPDYRNYILLAYKNMVDPEITTINGNLSVQDVLKEALGKLKLSSQ